MGLLGIMSLGPSTPQAPLDEGPQPVVSTGLWPDPSLLGPNPSQTEPIDPLS